MNAMCWTETRVYNGEVFIHPTKPGVLCLLRQVEKISREFKVNTRKAGTLESGTKALVRDPGVRDPGFKDPGVRDIGVRDQSPAREAGGWLGAALC